MRYDPIKELNREKERELLRPLIFLILAVLLFIPLGVAILLSFKEEIDAFSMKHPVILAFCFLIPGTIGWIIYGRKQNLW